MTQMLGNLFFQKCNPLMSNYRALSLGDPSGDFWRLGDLLLTGETELLLIGDAEL